MDKKVFLIAGEPSGDALGAGLIQALSAQSVTPVTFTGIGGDLMNAQDGFTSLLPIDELSIMGIWEVIWQLPRLLKLINAIVDEIHEADPDIVITIDSQELSYQVVSRLRKRGVFKGQVIHYVAPTVWAWRPGRAPKLAQIYDGLMCLFPFEPDYFRPHGLHTACVGHPLVGYGLENADGAAFRAENHVSPDAEVLGLFFGSREEEIKMMATPIMEAVSIIKETYPDIQIVVPTLPKMEYDVLAVLRRWDCEAIVVADPDLKWNAFAACNLAIAVSGTVGLELAYMGIPHVIAYKTHPVNWLMVKYMVKVRHAHLANILLEEAVVPECLQGRCNGPHVATEVLKLLGDQDTRTEQINAFSRLRAALGADAPQTPSQKAAGFTLMLEQKIQSERRRTEEAPDTPDEAAKEISQA